MNTAKQRTERQGVKDFGGEREMGRAIMAIIIHILLCFLIMETTTAVDTVSNSGNPFYSSNIHWEYNDRLYDSRPGGSESGSVQPHDFVVKERRWRIQLLNSQHPRIHMETWGSILSMKGTWRRFCP
jgi:hypothetical protein